eukprot:5641293-Amphidinium_carterae.1
MPGTHEVAIQPYNHFRDYVVAMLRSKHTNKSPPRAETQSDQTRFKKIERRNIPPDNTFSMR